MIAEGLDLTSISERQLRERLKKSFISLENQQRLSFSCFLNLTNDRVVSADKMMNKAKGPAWYKKHKEKGIVPKNLRALDKEATWCKLNADGWVYCHGSFSLTSYKVLFLGAFIWMKNSASEARKMWLETSHFKDQIDYVAMGLEGRQFKGFSRI